ncbi:ImmA/IrrE family metallo-endopeptidase [Actinophytocola xanthii]|uniref:ImmA/IrrE family metallo-endopeptidase n=1 Tax=Actinophytocola xanthii TaxID=1912961 RepID=UPI0013010A83|nr:ImmA/IrrE family metallo-endopeptidase [Actinophytocola xanthii]
MREVRRLDLRPPLDIGALCARLGEQRGRPIHPLPMTARPTDPSGIWIASQTADYVFYEQNTSRLHSEHIILHEIGHLLFGHTGGGVLSDSTARLLLPNLDPALVRRTLARSHYSDSDEQEAELFASLILSETGFAVVPLSVPEPPEEMSELVRRVWAVLGSPGRS